jgi:hypothetical protein
MTALPSPIRFEDGRPQRARLINRRSGSIDFVEENPTSRSREIQPRAGRVRNVGQATKGVRWMPRRQEPMKDVAGSEMLRGAASKL